MFSNVMSTGIQLCAQELLAVDVLPSSLLFRSCCCRIQVN
jgi:hypothetical protein